MEAESLAAPERFEHLMNKDNSTTVLWLVDVQRILNEGRLIDDQREREHLLRADGKSSHSDSCASDSTKQPIEKKAFWMLQNQIKCEIGIDIGPSANPKRNKKGIYDVYLTIELLCDGPKYHGRHVRADIRTFCEGSEKPAFKTDSLEIGADQKYIALTNCECYNNDDRIAFDINFDTKSFCEEECDDYPGLVNMGMTCYMNSYLQTMFHLKDFVRSIFKVSAC